MSRRTLKFALVLIVLATWLLVLPARAQIGAGAKLYPLDISQFPHISAYLDVRDEQGHFIPGLQAQDTRVLRQWIA